jgi:hypothetical protein
MLVHLMLAMAAMPGLAASDGNDAGRLAAPQVLAALPCDADAAGFAVGQSFTPALATEAQRAAGASSVRTLRPGIAVPLVMMEGRLTLVLDEGRRVIEVHCN